MIREIEAFVKTIEKHKLHKSEQPKIALVVCSDSNLVWQSAHLLQQVRANEPAGEIDLYYYTNEAIAARMAPLFDGVTTVLFDGELIDNGHGRPSYISVATLLRIHALKELNESYQRGLYLDSDIFLRWGQLSDLLQIDFGGAPIAAVRNRAQWGNKTETWTEKKYLPRLPLGAQTKYFNAGVILTNSETYEAQDISGKALQYLQDYPERCHYGDQTALNAAVAGNWAELSPSWNWQANMRYDFMIPARDPRLVHFTGPIKPWKDKMRRFDEYYAQSMKQWLRANRHVDLIASDMSDPFDAAKDRLRARLATQDKKNPLKMREFSKSYMNRNDFVDIQAGIQAWGWSAV